MVFRCTSGACSFVFRSTVLSFMSAFENNRNNNALPFPRKTPKGMTGHEIWQFCPKTKVSQNKAKNHWENRWNIRQKELPLYSVELIEVLQNMEYRNILYLTKS